MLIYVVVYENFSWHSTVSQAVIATQKVHPLHKSNSETIQTVRQTQVTKKMRIIITAQWIDHATEFGMLRCIVVFRVSSSFHFVFFHFCWVYAMCVCVCVKGFDVSACVCMRNCSKLYSLTINNMAALILVCLRTRYRVGCFTTTLLMCCNNISWWRCAKKIVFTLVA